MKKWYVIGVLHLIILFYMNHCLAYGNIKINASKEKILEGEEIEITLYSTTTIGAYQIELIFDNKKLEYITSDNELSNCKDNRIRSIWFDKTGGKSPKINTSIIRYKFKAKETGTISFGVEGNIYDNNGNEINMDPAALQIEITKSEEIDINKDQNNVNMEDTKLQILRLDKEGINPLFDPEIKEYYFTTQEDIEKLDVTAIPNNKKATVNVSGNYNLQYGLNKINIEVISENKKQKDQYIINVTKTKDLEQANSNLENLAVEYTILFPSFDANVTQYHAELSNTIEKVKILAVPENIYAQVKIEGNQELKIGNNKIIVTVIAQNGYTSKKYEISIYRRNEKEEREKEAEQNVQIEKLSSVLENNIVSNSIQKEEEQKSNKKSSDNFIIGLILIIAILIIGILSYRRKSNSKQ